MMAGKKTALVFGASGVSGWSFVNEVLHDYPQEGVWDGCIALTNRPLDHQKTLWPKDERLSLVSGVDLLKGSQDDLNRVMKEKVLWVGQITHVFYLAYKAHTDLNYEAECEENIEMFKRAVIAVDTLSPALEFVVLQTGAKSYGCHLLRDRPSNMVPPLAETLPRLSPPHDAGLFYYPQVDWISEYSKNKSWSWCETRPDIVVGFVPNGNWYSLGTVLGIFFSLFLHVHGLGAECPFPGSQDSWNALSIDASADMIARQTIHLSTTAVLRIKKGDAFNVGDAKTPSCWREKWPILCEYFGLKGVKREQDNPIEVRSFIRENLSKWEELEDKHGLEKGHADNPKIYPGFEYFLITQFDTDRHYDMSKMYGTGFGEESSTIEAWGKVFDRMRDAKIIPSALG
ncbi:sirq protein [Colletotrichum truncatum]|uniref:Sirq protein n=1 Tax=Colletotrichum truncatum TaxID=5467 RepID=A0ACC3Z850_COLTU|nr:sirq protein [Colletotrichum truncatum]KAF6783673.1 sirq protein [Colletotrichum truncatum]